MKRLIIVFVILFAGLFNTESKAWNAGVNFNFFYHNLSPYGKWIEVDYNLIVWKPYNTDRYWTPYSVGHWEYTTYGWYWDSYEPFGWATYHYGRWYYDNYYGWVWVPGYEWGPSWVEWRYSDAYIGWSPLPPYADFRISVGIHFSFNYRTSYHHWNFVTYNRFYHRNVNVYFVNVNQKNYIFNNTKYRTNYYADRGRIINGGIDRNYIERKAGTRITEREITRTTNLRDYTSSRGNSNSSRIVTYQPDDREVNKYRGTEIKINERASSKSNLKNDMVTFRNQENQSRESITNRSETDRTRGYINKSKQDGNNSSRINSNNDDARNPKTYRNTQPVRNVDNRESYKNEQPIKRNERTYRKPSTQNDISKAPEKSAAKSTSRISAPEVKNNKSSKPPVSINRNTSSNREKSVHSGSSSKRETSKSDGRTSSQRKGR